MRTQIHRHASSITVLAAVATSYGVPVTAADDVVAKSFDSAPGTDGLFTTLSPPALNTAGDVAFDAFTDSVFFPVGIWSDRGGALALVAASGDLAPDTDPFTGFDQVSLQGFNDSGRVALTATLFGPSIIPFVNDFGIWVETESGLELVVRLGMLTGLGPESYFEEIRTPIAFNDNGQVAFYARVTGDTEFSVWVGSPGIVTLAARSGMLAPGTGGTFDQILSALPTVPTDPVLNDTGQVMIHATVTGSGIDNSNDQGIWIGAPGQLYLVAREGDPVPEMADHVYVGFQPLDQLALNDTAQAAFVAAVDDQSGFDGDGTYLLAGGPTDLNPVARIPGAFATLGPLDHPAGTSSDTLWTGFGDFAISAAGKVALTGFIGGPGVDQSNDSGVWSTRTGTTSLVAREGDTPIDSPPTHEFQTFWNFCMGSTGRGALLAEGAELLSNEMGVWTEEDTGLLPRLRPGDTIDGVQVVAVSAGRSLEWPGGEDGRPRWYNNDRETAALTQLIDGRDAIVIGGGTGGPACGADLDGDGNVGFGDILQAIAAWGPCVGACPEDLSGNGAVDFADILAIIAAWGGCA